LVYKIRCPCKTGWRENQLFWWAQNMCQGSVNLYSNKLFKVWSAQRGWPDTGQRWDRHQGHPQHQRPRVQCHAQCLLCCPVTY
jgi:hypothetical protein